MLSIDNNYYDVKVKNPAIEKNHSAISSNQKKEVS